MQAGHRHLHHCRTTAHNNRPPPATPLRAAAPTAAAPQPHRRAGVRPQHPSQSPASSQHLPPSARATATAAQPPNATASSTTATAPGAPAYRPMLSRRTTDPLPPLGSKTTGLLKLGEGHWCLRQDFILTENIYLNTHILRLRSGGLMMINPPSVTEEAVALLGSLAEEAGGAAATTPPGGGDGGQGLLRVEHVVLPNLSPEHWYPAPDWAPRLAPNATLWTVPGLLQGRSSASVLGGPERVRRAGEVYGRILELPDFGPLPGLEGEVEVATFHESLGFFSESVLWFRDYRAAAFADMAFAAYDHPRDGWLQLESAKLAGMYRRLGCPIVYVMLQKDPRVARAWLQRVLSWDVDRVLASHFDPVVPNAAAELRRCFDFLLAQP